MPPGWSAATCRAASPAATAERPAPTASPRVEERASRPVSRVLYGGLVAHVAAIRLGRPLPDASRNQPGRLVRKRLELSRARAAPIRSCSRWGLPCRPRCRVRGGLLPHLFTLAPMEPPEGGLRLATKRRKAPTSASKRSVFCGTFPEVALAGRWPAPSFRGARTFLPGEIPGAAARPTGPPSWSKGRAGSRPTLTASP